MKEKYISVYKGKNWTSYIVSYKGQTKTFSEAKYGQNALKMAVKWRNKITTEPIVQVIKGKSVKDCFEEVKEFYSLRAETIRKYDLLFNKYMTDYQLINIDRLKKADIIECLNKMVDVASDNTIQRVFTIWKKMIYMANAKEYLEREITFGILPPKSRLIRKPREIKQIDKDKMKQITEILGKQIHLVYDRRMIPLILWTLYYTGMRPCECLALDKSDIRDGFIHIEKEIGSDRTDADVIRTCKTPTSVRKIPISNELVPYINEAMELSPSHILFGTRFSRYYKTQYIDDRVRYILNKHGLSINMYALRHNFSTQLLKSGTDARTIQELMGHAHYTMTIDYARSDLESMAKAVEKM